MYDTKGASRWYSRGHTGYYMKDFLTADSRITIIKDWVKTEVKVGGKVADIGCGDMSLANLMPDQTWTGFDLDDKKDPRIIKQDISETPYNIPDSTFDGLVCSEVLEHVFEPHVVISEFNRILKVGGVCIITVPNFDSLDFHLEDRGQLLFNPKKFWTLEHIRWFNNVNMSELLKQRGFHVLKIQGAAHCFSGIMSYAVTAYQKYAKETFNKEYTAAEAGVVVGLMFPMYSPGLAFLCRKVM